MNNTKTNGIFKTISVVGLALALLAGAPAADAQDREDRWEFTLGTFYQFGTSLDGQGGSTLDTDDDFGLSIGGAYNFTDRLATSFAFQWAGIGYDGQVVEDEGGVTGVYGSYDSLALSANGIFFLTEGQLAPYVGAGIGWTWIDTNIPDGLPSGGCWWDPWWGYVCSYNYPTKKKSGFSYQATLGLRYTFDSDRTFLQGGYTSQWMDIGDTDGTPRFDVIRLEFGWIF